MAGADLDHTIAALAATVRASLRALTADLNRIERGERVPLGPVIREADVLSACCSRLDKMVDHVPEEPAPASSAEAQQPVVIGDVVEALRRIRAIETGDVCDVCGRPHPPR